MAERRYPASKVRGGEERSYPTSEVRGGGWEEIPHAPKPEARGSGQEDKLPNAPKPEARGSSPEEQPHARVQEQWPGAPTPRPRSHGCVCTGGPRGAIPH